MTEIWGAVTAAAVIGAGATVYEGSQNRAFAAAQAGNQSAIQQTQFGEQQQYAAQLQNLIANPSQVTSLPGYQFMFDQGQQAVSRQAAAGGFLNSGNEGTALTQYGQGFATNALTQQEQLLASLSGLSAPVQGNPVGAVNASTNAQNSSNAQLNNLLSQLGLATSTFGRSTAGSSAGTPATSTGNWSLPGSNFDGSGNASTGGDFSTPPPGNG
jgi:hypothetical protein